MLVAYCLRVRFYVALIFRQLLNNNRIVNNFNQKHKILWKKFTFKPEKFSFRTISEKRKYIHMSHGVDGALWRNNIVLSLHCKVIYIIQAFC